ncbi:MAG: glutamate--tRNA ligase [Candidatus Omnitrophica bacterium]|nr:glutamate--tRNA ligase [Candidatus Omnitrophota bacterium]
MIRVRFAPSPTGYLHIGGARTALFNWMYAKSQGGKFILRIEDTDKARSKSEYLDEILDSMRWLGLDWDEFYKQSDRFDLYRQYAQKLLDEGRAYKDGEAVLLTMPQKIIKIYDLIRDEISIDTREIKDQVLMKSDGSPTYSFACVIDDALMEISCVIRGEDHISNTPKQIVIYEALGFKPPKFAHLPLILDDERARLSKRAGAVAVSDYRRQGFLPEAVVNYLMLLGWSPGNNQEKVALAAAVKNFSIKKINKAGAAFDMDKLKWLNGQYIKEMDTARLTELIKPLVAEKYGPQVGTGTQLQNIVHLFKGRMSTLADFLEWTDFIFLPKVNFDEQVKMEHLSKNLSKEFNLLADRLEKIADFNAKAAEEAFRAVVSQLGLEAGTLVHPVRVALTGRAVGPGLFDTMAVLGKQKAVERLRTTFNGPAGATSS